MPRMHHSCDQCRRSKRACDAPRIDAAAVGDGDAAALLKGGGGNPAPRGKPCSYCARTSKTCTMNWAWQQMQIARALEAVASGVSESAVASGRQRQDPNHIHGPVSADRFPEPLPGMISVSVSADPGLPDTLNLPPQPPPPPMHHHYFDVVTPPLQPGLGIAYPAPEFPLEQQQPIFFSLPDPFSPVHPSPHSTFSEPYGSQSTFSEPYTTQSSISQSTDFTALPKYTPYIPSPTSLTSSSSSLPSRPTSDPDADTPPHKRRRRHTTQSSFHPSLSTPFSPPDPSLNHALALQSAHTSISTSLLRIYHDVLEHNLSCWLTEASCPYVRPDAASPPGRHLAEWGEWGPTWSNRVFGRTVRLDRAATAAGLVRVTRAQDQAAGRALHAAIMAFATQWAQGSHRQQMRWRRGSSPGIDAEAQVAEEFDRSMQRHLWHTAKTALEAVADVESYRVACAELVFGLAQRPWEDDDVVTPAERTDRGAFDTGALMAEIARVVETDGPPVFIERAVRKMHALKSRHDAATRGWAHRQRRKAGQPAVRPLGREDETTVGLLYWLALMFDTVSSSMNERPISVTDQESQTSNDATTADEQWSVDRFIRDRLDAPSHRTSWPCSYDAAAEAVTRSATVKVLLYRHLSYLQAILLQRGQRGTRVEDAIARAVRVQRYWESTHGPFFRALVAHYPEVPARVRGWFVCISAHWHLAVLMLADLVELADDEGRGCEVQARARRELGAAGAMRAASVRELADLARVSTPGDEDGDGGFVEPHMPEFHHAVSEGTILTEPWTVILIRAFSRAAVVMLGEVDDCRRCGLSGGEDGVRRVEDCIRTLFYLGRKSDMARRVADVLAESLDGLREGEEVAVGT